jgi:hypothetical protein
LATFPLCRRIGDIPYIAPGEFLRAHQAQHAFRRSGRSAPPLAGRMMANHSATPRCASCTTACWTLRADGYHVPEFALEEIREELGEEADDEL